MHSFHGDLSIMASILRVNTLTDASSNNSIATSVCKVVVLKHG